jgi:hypothetical protein
MRKTLAIALLLASTPAMAADNAVTATPGSGVTMRTKDVGALVQQPFVGLGNDSGVSLIGAGSTVPVSGSVTVSGTPTVNQGTPPWTVNPGTASSWGVQGQGSTTPGQVGILNQAAVTTSSPTYTTGQTSPLSLDTAGNLRVNVVAGGASGGTSSNFGSAFPGIGTAIGLTNGTNMVAWSATTNYGTAPAAIAVPAVNAFVTNAVTPGRAASTASSPVVLPSMPTTWHLIALATTNATSVKASAAVVFSCQMSNNSITPYYLKIYNKASAPTVGTDVPVVTLLIPGPAAGGGGSNVAFGAGGLALATGFATSTNTGIADTDNVGVPATTLALNCQYE